MNGLKQQAIDLKNTLVAVIYERMADGACVHGNFDRGYDMEQSCHGCEGNNYATPEQQGYVYALQFLKVEKAKRILERVAYYSGDDYTSDSQVLFAVRAIKRLLEDA